MCSSVHFLNLTTYDFCGQICFIDYDTIYIFSFPTSQNQSVGFPEARFKSYIIWKKIWLSQGSRLHTITYIPHNSQNLFIQWLISRVLLDQFSSNVATFGHIIGIRLVDSCGLYGKQFFVWFLVTKINFLTQIIYIY